MASCGHLSSSQSDLLKTQGSFHPPIQCPLTAHVPNSLPRPGDKALQQRFSIPVAHCFTSFFLIYLLKAQCTKSVHR